MLTFTFFLGGETPCGKIIRCGLRKSEGGCRLLMIQSCQCEHLSQVVLRIGALAVQKCLDIRIPIKFNIVLFFCFFLPQDFTS